MPVGSLRSGTALLPPTAQAKTPKQVPGVQDGAGHQPLPMGSILSSSSLRGSVPRLPRRYRHPT